MSHVKKALHQLGNNPAAASAGASDYSRIKADIAAFFKGELADDEETLAKYSHDASLLEVRPKLVAFPKDKEDVKAIVKYVHEHKAECPDLSVTARAAGTCMSGGSLNESIILDVMRHMNKAEVNHMADEAVVEPGVFYRDFEKLTLAKNLLLPCYPASKNLCALGGMMGNNCAGEKTLTYGKMDSYVKELTMVLSDGSECVVKPLTRNELEVKIRAGGLEGEIYRKLSLLIRHNQDVIDAAKPDVSKNSAGYALWNVVHDDMFDLAKLIIGSQGTLGLITEARLRLVPVKPKSKLLVIFLKDIAHLSELVNEILPFKPESLESFDDKTLRLALKFLPGIMRSMKTAGFVKLLWSFIPEGLMMLTGGMPKLILLVEFGGSDDAVIDAEMRECERKIRHFGHKTRLTKSTTEAEKYWTIRRESFSLLRKHVHGKRTAPFIDDIIVKPEHLPEFIPQVTKILDEEKLVYTIAGHAGNGNFHIIPLMDMHHAENREVIMRVSEQIYDLVAKYKGSITAEHGDGIVRTPYLGKMFSPEMIGLFRETQAIFDPQDILNPGKKSGCTLEYFHDHIITEK